jgi:hypothetical protein
MALPGYAERRIHFSDVDRGSQLMAGNLDIKPSLPTNEPG